MTKGIRKIVHAPSAYPYPLLIKQLLNTPIYYAPDQEIVYRDQVRYTYDDMYRRVLRLGAALQSMDVKQGTKVGVLEWDSHRYLEMYFGIPGIGAVLHTINPRLAAEDVTPGNKRKPSREEPHHRSRVPDIELDLVGRHRHARPDRHAPLPERAVHRETHRPDRLEHPMRVIRDQRVLDRRFVLGHRREQERAVRERLRARHLHRPAERSEPVGSR